MNEVLPAQDDKLSAKQFHRWMKLGPWYAMFPLEFALQTIEAHTKPGQSVLDPFMGRGTTLAAAKMLDRNATGIEINPVAWIYASVKTQPAEKAAVLARLDELESLAKDKKIPKLPEFYDWCFHPRVLRFLLAAKKHLDWQNNEVDRTLMGIILVDLHGNIEDGLSNQMRQTKAMAPAYAVAWWKERGMHPTEKDPVAILKRKIEWRYHHGVHISGCQQVALHGDSTTMLTQARLLAPYHLLLTSPPYCGIINYNYDQWLRRWLLGGPELPKYSAGQYQNRLDNFGEYQHLLDTVFMQSAEQLHERAHVVVRTDARPKTLQATISALEKAFPGKHLSQIARPVFGKTQTTLFGDHSRKPGEVDIVMKPKIKRFTRGSALITDATVSLI